MTWRKSRPIPGRQAIAMDERDEQGGSWHPFRSLEIWADEKEGKTKITRSHIIVDNSANNVLCIRT
jgi:hypothetical protein